MWNEAELLFAWENTAVTQNTLATGKNTWQPPYTVLGINQNTIATIYSNKVELPCICLATFKPKHPISSLTSTLQPPSVQYILPFLDHFF